MIQNIPIPSANPTILMLAPQRRCCSVQRIVTSSSPTHEYIYISHNDNVKVRIPIPFPSSPFPFDSPPEDAPLRPPFPQSFHGLRHRRKSVLATTPASSDRNPSRELRSESSSLQSLDPRSKDRFAPSIPLRIAPEKRFDPRRADRSRLQGDRLLHTSDHLERGGSSRILSKSESWIGSWRFDRFDCRKRVRSERFDCFFF